MDVEGKSIVGDAIDKEEEETSNRMIQILLSLPFLQSDQRLLCNSRVAAALPMLECSAAKNHM